METIWVGEDKDLYINLKKPDQTPLDLSAATGIDTASVAGYGQFEKARTPIISARDCAIIDDELGRIKFVVEDTDFKTPVKSGTLICWFLLTSTGGLITSSDEYSVEVVKHPRK